MKEHVAEEEKGTGSSAECSGIEQREARNRAHLAPDSRPLLKKKRPSICRMTSTAAYHHQSKKKKKILYSERDRERERRGHT